MHLLRRIEQYLRDNAVSPSRFGRDAVNDPRFVFDLRDKGRTVRDATRDKVTAYLDAKEAA
jgi:hypothetical protein